MVKKEKKSPTHLFTGNLTTAVGEQDSQEEVDAAKDAVERTLGLNCV